MRGSWCTKGHSAQLQVMVKSFASQGVGGGRRGTLPRRTPLLCRVPTPRRPFPKEWKACHHPRHLFASTEGIGVCFSISNLPAGPASLAST